MGLDLGVEGGKRFSSREGMNDEFRWADTSIDDTETFWFRRSGASTPAR
jgi:hypothetical protein